MTGAAEGTVTVEGHGGTHTVKPAWGMRGAVTPGEAWPGAPTLGAVVTACDSSGMTTRAEGGSRGWLGWPRHRGASCVGGSAAGTVGQPLAENSENPVPAWSCGQGCWNTFSFVSARNETQQEDSRDEDMEGAVQVCRNW